MTRVYTTKPASLSKTRSWYDDGEDFHPADRVSIDVEETQLLHHNTGILSPDGSPIYWTERREPIGFIRVSED